MTDFESGLCIGAGATAFLGLLLATFQKSRLKRAAEYVVCELLVHIDVFDVTSTWAPKYRRLFTFRPCDFYNLQDAIKELKRQLN